MRAMQLVAFGKPLARADIATPALGPHDVAISVQACGVCRTDLHLVDGELPHAHLPVIPGHEIVGLITEVGSAVANCRPGERVGVPWLGWTCGQCAFCRSGRENLCSSARFTGYQINGGYAERTIADSRFCFPIPERFSSREAAPLLCAGLIGYRAYAMVPEAETLGIFGFGAAAHIIAQIAVQQGKRVFAFTREGDRAAQEFASELGVEWAGSSTQGSPVLLDAALIFAPVGALVPAALRATLKGGTVVCAGIHMSDIPSFPYALLWEERTVRSVANLTRHDGDAFFALVATLPVQTHTQAFALEEANEALAALRAGRLKGAAVLIP
jgi:propanol-preferring alcohol dehydrogenase